MARGFLDDDRRRGPTAGQDAPRKSDLVDIAAELRRETDRAWLIFDGDREAWIPKSQAERGRDTFTMPEWLAREKGLI
jgi:hypothetical protein